MSAIELTYEEADCGMLSFGYQKEPYRETFVGGSKKRPMVLFLDGTEADDGFLIKDILLTIIEGGVEWRARVTETQLIEMLNRDEELKLWQWVEEQRVNYIVGRDEREIDLRIDTWREERGS